MNPNRLTFAAVALFLVATSCAEPQRIPEVQQAPSPTTSLASIASTTTTSTIPPEAIGFARWAARVSKDARALADRSSEINARWEDRSASYRETDDSLQALLDDTESLLAANGVQPSPSDVTRDASRLSTLLASMATEAEAMIVGLGSDDDGTIRRTAHAQLLLASTEITEIVAHIHDELGIVPPTELSTSVTTSVPTTSTTTTSTSPPTTTQPKSRPSCGADSYINVDGNCVPSPRHSPTVPAGATAQCRDGTYSFSQHRQGTCSHHGGVASWLP